tara:strand:- start:5139 stop:5717 length:579 start_codon:yes stop_codon:yes gene_type:complete
MKNKTLEIQPIFSSFLIQKKLDLDTKSIKTWIEKSSHTDYKIPLTFNESVLKDFYVNLKEILDHLHIALGFSKNMKQKFQEAWVNVDSNERTSLPHTHPTADFVCVYYPYVEEGSGHLEFINPNSAVEYALPQAGKNTIIDNYNIFNSKIWQVVPENNLLIIFPSWLHHYVRKSNSNTTRMSIALNSKIVSK